MNKLNDLKDLLAHEIMVLVSASEKMIEALPFMIEKAGNEALKAILKEHLRITKMQSTRLDRVSGLLGINEKKEDKSLAFKIATLFRNDPQKSKAMDGILAEGENILKLEMDADVLDAAIIASAQKAGHYKICGYGTARAFAKELNLNDVTTLLYESLQEEYQTDDLLTKLAVGGGINREAEIKDASEGFKKVNQNDGRPARKKPTDAKSFYGGGKKAPAKKTGAASADKGEARKKSTPNRRQVPGKQQDDNKPFNSRSSTYTKKGAAKTEAPGRNSKKGKQPSGKPSTPRTSRGGRSSR